MNYFQRHWQSGFALLMLFLAAIFNVALLESQNLSVLFQFAYRHDQITSYSLRVTGDKLHVGGFFGFGLSHDVAKLLAQNPQIRAIVLESNGGRLVEGERLAQLISARRLDTYSFSSCSSACTLAYIAGKRRFLGPLGSLGFHQYGSSLGIISSLSLRHSQENTKALFRAKGVTEEFIAKIFNTRYEQLWFPSRSELLASNVVHQILKGSVAGEIDKQLLKSPIFQTIKKYEPDNYRNVRQTIEEMIAKGGSTQQFSIISRQYFKKIYAQALTKTSDAAIGQLIIFERKILSKIKSHNPRACPGLVDKRAFGSFDVMPYLGKEEANEFTQMMDKVIRDSYEKKGPPININEAQAFKRALNAQMRAASAGRPRSCDTVDLYFRLLLRSNPHSLGNLIRYESKFRK